VVNCDSQGSVLSISTESAISNSPVKEILLAVQLAIHQGLKYVYFEGDAKIVIDSLNDLDHNVGWDFQLIIYDIRSLLCNFNCAIILVSLKVSIPFIWLINPRTFN
jgi:hypothetical protein